MRFALTVALLTLVTFGRPAPPEPVEQHARVTRAVYVDPTDDDVDYAVMLVEQRTMAAAVSESMERCGTSRIRKARVLRTSGGVSSSGELDGSAVVDAAGFDPGALAALTLPYRARGGTRVEVTVDVRYTCASSPGQG